MRIYQFTIILNGINSFTYALLMHLLLYTNCELRRRLSTRCSLHSAHAQFNKFESNDKL